MKKNTKKQEKEAEKGRLGGGKPQSICSSKRLYHRKKNLNAEEIN